MAKGGGSSPSPDPRIGEAAVKQADTGEAWLRYASERAAAADKRQGPIDELAAKVQNTQLGIMNEQAGYGRADRERYEKTFQPMENRLVDEANAAGTVAKQNEAAASAAADVQSAASGARGTAAREAEAVGITPGSGQYAGIERAGQAGTELAVAGAKNNARAGERARGLALTADVANMGRGLPAQAATGAAGAVNAGNSAYGIAGNNQQLAMAPAQLQGQGYQAAMGGHAGAANTLSNLYGLQLQKYQIDQEAKASGVSGIANAIGSFAGLAAMSDKKAKKNISKVKKGAGLKAVKNMPVSKFDYKPGQGDGGKGHVGTMAQDFKRETGSGDGKSIKFQDAIGISMKAIQDLDDKVDKLSKQLGAKPPKERRKSQSPAKARHKDDGPKKAKPYKAPKKPSQQLGIRIG